MQPHRLQHDIEVRQLNWRQWAIVALLTLALILDGLDVKILSFAAPLILSQWQISKAAFGPVLAAALIGMAMGAWLGGRAGDRFGRRIVVVASLALFGMTTVLAGVVEGIVPMTALRFVSGIGFGAVTPNAYALVSEWLPARARPFAIALITVGSPLGGSLGALAALWLLPTVGWQGCFIIAGVATLGLTAASAWLPESPAFLIARGRRDAAARQFRRVFVSDPPASPLLPGEPAQPPARPDEAAPGSIWQRPFARINIGTALCFFCTHFVNYALATWGTVIFTTAGVSLAHAIEAGFFYNVLAVLFGFGTGPLLRRTGSAALLWADAIALAVLVAIIGACLVTGFAHSFSGSWVLLAAFSLAGGISGSLITVVAAVASAAYPDRLRATGVGLGISAGRIGGIASILVGGQLLTLGHDNPTLLLALLSLLGLCIMASAVIIDRHLPVRWFIHRPAERGEDGLR